MRLSRTPRETLVMTSLTTTEFGTVVEAMSPGVISCSPETPLRTVARMMNTYRVHCVVVFGHDEELAPWGVVSDLDLVRAAASEDLDVRNAGATAATPVVLVEPEERLDRAAQLMADHETTHLVVADQLTGRPLGVLSTLDIARAIATR
jgi:CBS domain-containing protein